MELTPAELEFAMRLLCAYWRTHEKQKAAGLPYRRDLQLVAWGMGLTENQCRNCRLKALRQLRLHKKSGPKVVTSIVQFPKPKRKRVRPPSYSIATLQKPNQ